ncbi:MAG: hypothetical protein J7L14_00050 [Candidatus Diapherotrites archaeon]|nr:hypothetical protein [Candidatus Diapherotrites archaeon]
MQNANNAQLRFSMVKQRHRKTFEEALAKGLVDRQLIPICKFISKQREFFTSSGCAGRILLICLPKGEEKKEAFFVAKWHRKVKFSELKEALAKECNNELWFKQEPFILHIGTNTIENARKILKIAKKAGIKRGGIMHLGLGKIMIELVGTQYLSLPIKKGKKLLADDRFIKFILQKANKKLEKNYERLKKFERILISELSP